MMLRLGQIGGKLYRGEVSFDFVGRQRLWYTISGQTDTASRNTGGA